MVSTRVVSLPEIYQQSSENLSDLTLVNRAKSDLTQFSILYEQYATRVYHYLLLRVSNVHDAQDLTSQTFMAAMKGLKSYQGKAPFSAWLFGIARNKAADMFRRRRSFIALEEAGSAHDPREELEETIDRQMAVEQVALKLQNISPDRAEALSLRLFGNLDVGEIARIMGRQKSAVRMLIFRGLRDLKVQLSMPETSIGYD